MAERYGRGHGDGVAREQAQFHTLKALRHAVAHRWHATGHLGRGTLFAGLGLDQVRVMLQRRVGRQQVVVGGDDANIGRLLGHHLELVCPGQRGKGVRHIGATHALGAGLALAGGIHLGQIGAAGGRAARNDALGDGVHRGMQIGGIAGC